MEPYNGLFRKGMNMSRSSPCIAASFNLREYSQRRNRLPTDTSQTSLPALELTEIDLLGGNGFRRQRQAEAYFAKKRVEDQQAAQQERRLQQEKLQRRQERDARRRRLQREQEERVREKEEIIRLSEEDQQSRRQQQQERERLQKKQEERDWLARQPQKCRHCHGTGLCSDCDGTGEVFTLFLVSQVDANPSIGNTFGRKNQGCASCGGCRQGLAGALQLGTGECPFCNGTGKVWPEQAFAYQQRQQARPPVNRKISMSFSMSSPKAMASGFSSPRASVFS